MGLRFPAVERRGKEVVKFHLFMRAGGETTTFEAGRECFFSKTVLAALALASPEVLSRPLQLATYVKELRTGDRTLAVALRDSAGNKLSCDWTNDDDWQAIGGAGVGERADGDGGLGAEGLGAEGVGAEGVGGSCCV